MQSPVRPVFRRGSGLTGWVRGFRCMGLCLGAAWLMGCAALAGPESGWTWRNPLPTANNL